MSNPLLEFTDDELQKELARRRNLREREEQPVLFCDECSNFKFGTGDCMKGHKMNFRVPKGYECYEYGYYRRACVDRIPRSNN